MGLKALNVFKLSNRFKLLKYSFGSRLINSVPKGLSRTYDFINWLEQNSIPFQRKDDYIEFEYPVKSIQYRFCINESSSDSDVFRQIVVDEEYNEVINLIRENSIEINTIVDAGANVGFTSLYLSQCYPNADIVALEPNPETFLRLNRNVKTNNLTNIRLFQKGIWSENTYLKPDRTYRDGEDWSYRLEDAQSEADKKIEVISINSLMHQLGWNNIDLLKIDIEGGERDLFRKDTDISWLETIKIIAIEIHDEFDCRDTIENLFREKGFHLYHSGELTIGINTRCLQ